MKGVIKLSTVVPRVPCEAIQVTKGFADIAKWCGGNIVWEPTGHKFSYIICGDGTGTFRAYRNYWIVMRNGTVVDVCDPARFHTAWRQVHDL